MSDPILNDPRFTPHERWLLSKYINYGLTAQASECGLMAHASSCGDNAHVEPGPLNQPSMPKESKRSPYWTILALVAASGGFFLLASALVIWWMRRGQ